jgi:hypothetical protein
MNAVAKIRPETAEPVVEGLALLRAPFPAHQISKLPKPTKAQTDAVKADFKAGIRCAECGAWHHPQVVHLDYVGHAALTDRLLDADPNWSWEPVAFRDGLPAFDSTGGLWIKLTVCDVSRLGYGHAAVKPNQDPGAREKEVIGDALRNAAMRFGAALDLWHKGDLHADSDEAAETPKAQPTAQTKTTGATAPTPPTLAQRADRLTAALRAQTTADALRKAYELASGLCADLDMKDPERLVEINNLYEARFIELSEPKPKDDFGIGDDEIPY